MLIALVECTDRYAVSIQLILKLHNSYFCQLTDIFFSSFQPFLYFYLSFTNKTKNLPYLLGTIIKRTACNGNVAAYAYYCVNKLHR